MSLYTIVYFLIDYKISKVAIQARRLQNEGKTSALSRPLTNPWLIWEDYVSTTSREGPCELRELAKEWSHSLEQHRKTLQPNTSEWL